jgi:DNA-binding SARP family transcriptional activator/tetratricopeptide (TPR) repeat protein
MEVRLFGEILLLAAGEQLDVGTPRQQSALAALLVDAPRPVAMERLIDRVWDDNPPAEARNVLYSHLSRIRGLLRRAATLDGRPGPLLERRHAGYVLDIDPELVDLHRFRRLVERGRAPGLTEHLRAAALGEALGLAEGVPLAGLEGRWATQVRDSLLRMRLEAAVGWADANLRLGRPEELIGTLPDLVAEYPSAEPLEGLLMRALHEAGRDAEAIERYAGARRRLVDALGTDPGPELRAVHEAILRGESPGPSGRAVAVGASAPVAVPAQLPPDLAAFTGREEELRQLDRLLTGGVRAPASGRGGAVFISAIDGTAGIGKTALAVHWAHRVAARFRDGQLYVNLRGFDPTGEPVSSTEALCGFLDALEVPAARLPASLDAQVGLYRSLLAGRRVLLVLDNASDAEQVRPLLPGTSGCATVVTSRSRLAGLVAGSGAHPLTVGLPSVAEARELLAARIGTDRVAAEAAAVDEIIARSARLPLALSIVAARAAARPGFGLTVLAAELAGAQDRLDEFADADPAANVRIVFSWSYRLLSPAAARLFRLIGLHPGTDISAAAAASLAGLAPAVTRTLLTELTRAHLLSEPAPGRYGFHDLLRAYAGGEAESTDPADERRAAVGRVLDYYLHTATAGMLLLDPLRLPVDLCPMRPGVVSERFAGSGPALDWFAAERAVLVAAVHHAAARGFEAHAWQLAWALTTFLYYRGHTSDNTAVQRVGLAAAERSADPAVLAQAHHLMGRALLTQGSLDEAQDHLQRAGSLAVAIGDPVVQGQSCRFLACVAERRNRPAEALEHSRRAAALFQRAGWRPGLAAALNDIGWYHAELGDSETALDFCRRSLAEHEALGNLDGQAFTCDSIGYAYHRLGRYAQAIRYYKRALDLLRAVGDRAAEADTLYRLGESQRATGEPAAARVTWQEAAILLDQVDPARADAVRAKLRDLAACDPGTYDPDTYDPAVDGLEARASRRAW